MPKWEFTATSRTGHKVNPITGAPTDTITVYSQTELDQRIKAAKNDPRNLDIHIRKLG
jgi:hypothetical protein